VNSRWNQLRDIGKQKQNIERQGAGIKYRTVISLLRRDFLLDEGRFAPLSVFRPWLRGFRVPLYHADLISALTNAQTDVRVRRRALTLDECRLLVETVERSKERFGMSGLERAMLYRVAIGTGLRVSELRSLKTENFDLDAEPSTVAVEACYSKHRRRDVQPIARPLVGDLRAFLAHKDPRMPDILPAL
jgi:integrase